MFWPNVADANSKFHIALWPPNHSRQWHDSDLIWDLGAPPNKIYLKGISPHFAEDPLGLIRTQQCGNLWCKRLARRLKADYCLFVFVYTIIMHVSGKRNHGTICTKVWLWLVQCHKWQDIQDISFHVELYGLVWEIFTSVSRAFSCSIPCVSVMTKAIPQERLMCNEHPGTKWQLCTQLCPMH